MNINDILYKRNRHVAIIMWFCSFLITENVKMIVIGIGISTIIEVLSRIKKYAVFSMCSILFLSNLFIFLQTYFTLSIIYWLFIFVFFSISVLYQHRLAIFISSIFSLAISTYFWFGPQQLEFDDIGSFTGFMHFLFIFLVMGFLFFNQMNLNQNIQKDSNMKRKQAIIERKKTGKILEHMNQSLLQTTSFSEQLKEHINDFHVGYSQTSKQIEGMTQRFEENTANVEKIYYSIEHSNEHIQEVNGLSMKLKEVSKFTNDSSIKGEEQLKLVRDENNKTEIIFSNLRQNIQLLHNQTNEILAIINIILNIQQKANLLALNASIEAEREGNAGVGFTVIAKEMRALSNETKNFATKINTILDQFTFIMKDVVEASTETFSIMQNQKEAIFHTQSVFNEVKNNSVTVLDFSEKIDGLMKEVTHLSEHIFSQIQQLSQYNEENESELQSILPIFQYQQSQISKLSYNFTELENSLKELISEKGVDE